MNRSTYHHDDDSLLLWSSSNNNNKNNNESDNVIQIESLSEDQIAELIEVSFIQACLSLAQGYVDTLKLFIVAVKASYERGNVSVSRLIQAVNECPTNTAGRPLMPEEEALRSTWIHAVHLMLDHINHPRPLPTESEDNDLDIDIDATVRETYNTSILNDIVAAQESNVVWNTNDFVARHKEMLLDDDDPVQTAIISQTIKVLYYTLVVLAEERLANVEEGDNDDVTVTAAKPRIPRGTGFN